MSELGLSLEELAGQPLELFAREGAKLLLTVALEEEVTAETFRGGWFRTGDMGMMDKEGYVYIMDRKKDIVISGGENISAREVENIICGHHAVLECAVIAVPSERWGEDVKAIVVPKRGMSVSAEEIVDYCPDKLAGYKRPKSVEIWDELPRNPSGKVLKREMRERYWAGHKQRVH